MKNKRRPKQDRSHETYVTILQAAVAVAEDLSHEGFHRFSTEKVAAKAGVSIGSLYQYFSNKEELLGAMLDYLSEFDANLIQVTFQKYISKWLMVALDYAMDAVINERFQDHLQLYRFTIKNRGTIAKPETNTPIQEDIVRKLQDMLDRDSKLLNGHNSHHVAFIMSRFFMNVMGSVVLLRPEFLNDKEFLSLLKKWIINIPEMTT